MTTQCLTAVPPNVNITVGVVVSVLNALTLAPVPLVNSWSNSISSASLQASLLPGVDYILVLTTVSTRDLSWQEDPLDAAIALAKGFVGSPGL